MAGSRGRPAKRSRNRPVAGLILTPGASASRDQSALVAIDDAVREDGIAVERIDFPYRVAGRRAPDPERVLVATIIEAARDLQQSIATTGDRIALGGRSMGGRMCSIAVAQGLQAACLVLVSYPLHPPGRPERLRTEHFPAIGVPCLFLSGTRDAFGTPAELEEAAGLIKGQVTLTFIDGGDHSLRGKDARVAEAVREWLAGVS